jgi:hypothetical protein
VVTAVVSWALLRPPRPSGAEDHEVVSVELRRLPLIVALWLAVMLGSLWAAFETEVGPVLFVYNNHRSVRLGDLLATVAMVGVAAWATVVLLRPAEGDRAER